MKTIITGNRTFENGESLARDVAEWLCGLAQASDRNFAVCLYEILATPEIASRFPWNRAHWFWGDERFVPHDHPDSNFRMARGAFLLRVPVPDGNIHAVPTEDLSPELAARIRGDAKAILRRRHGCSRPAALRRHATWNRRGRTHPSLFPGQPTLQETSRWAVAVIGAKAEARITLTYPVLDSSREVAFLVTGKEKRSVVSRAQAGDRTLPAAAVHPIGRLHWFTDRAAAPGGAD
jgi:6-phosphogluconolactonase